MNIVRTPATVALLLLLGISCRLAHADDASRIQYLSDLLPDRAIAITQGWGYLGIDTMANSSVVVARQVTNLGELGLDTKVVPSGKPAAKLRIKDKDFTRGLGTHANGEILVDLSGGYKTFQADIGLQWMGGTSSGSVVFQVFVDGKKLFQSGVMRENDPPQPIEVSVQGANELRLVVSDAGDGITADCADWADARLTRNPAALEAPGKEPVDVGPFARVLSWDPKAMQGTKAIRSDEFPAADIAPYQEILPSSDGTYAVPVKDGVGCIGLEWAEDRILRRVEIEFPSEAAIPKATSVHLQYWSGESSWQGKWQPAKAAAKRIGNRLVWYLDFYEAPLGTPKVRWLFTDAKQPIAVRRLSAFTRSRWSLVDVWIQPARKQPIGKTEIEVYNGEIFSPSAEHHHCTWDGTTPLRLAVRAAVSRACKADRTVLRFRTPQAAFGVAIEDLLTHDCVYVPHANLFVARDPLPIAPEDYLKRIAGRQSALEQVRQRADQDLSHVCSVIHSPIQDRHNWVPMLISLACDNRKFLVFREGSVVFNEFSRPDDYPGESDGVQTTAANVNQWQLIPTFGSGRPLEISRRLNGGWFPMPVTTAKDGNVTYRQMTFIAPVDDAPAGGPVWLRERALGVIEYAVKNAGTEPADVRLSLRLAHNADPNKPATVAEVKGGIAATSGDRVLAFADNRKPTPLAWTLEPDKTLLLSGKLPPGGEGKWTVYLPAWNLAANDCETLLEGGAWAPRAERYWKDVLAPAMQVEIPDEFLANLIRASQVHCMLAARNQEHSKYVVPWIAAVHFAFPESEANSIMRGMDMTGHPEFTRRGLEFYLKEANPAGYITILVHNKVAGISSGYTLVGTGEILWTLGEHYQRTRDREWLKKVAPDVVRICQWVMRQRQKTKLLDAKGEKAPEYGLMPPGVSADWNRFAYRFFNEAQWYRGLEMAGRALADVGDTAAPAILADAKEYRGDILRAYREIQARCPVVPLRNGTWVPGGPSLLNCYGNVEDFLPGEDVNRTYVYSVEIGANHLVANEVLDAASDDAAAIVDHLEDDLFLRSNWIANRAGADEFDWGGYAKMQPYYCRIAEIHAMRDDVKPFIRSYFNVIPALLNFEDMTFWEDMISNGYASGAWNKTHETGWFLGQTRIMFAAERGDELWLAPFVTNQWLKDGQKVAVRNAPTRFGKVGYTITSKAAAGEIEAVVQLPKDCSAKKIVLRLRHPDGKPMQSVTVQGKPHADFDPKKATVTFVPEGESVTVTAEY
jgi:hypothetical protein